MKKTNPIIALLLWLTAAYAASFIGTQGALRGLQVIFPSLHRPALAPPLWLYTPLWTILSTLQGFAAWRVWLAEPPRRAALTFWWLQLALHVAWCWLFFAGNRLLPAFIISLALWLITATTTYFFAQKEKLALRLILPNLAWTTYATVLSLLIWKMNK